MSKTSQKKLSFYQQGVSDRRNGFGMRYKESRWIYFRNYKEGYDSVVDPKHTGLIMSIRKIFNEPIGEI